MCAILFKLRNHFKFFALFCVLPIIIPVILKKYRVSSRHCWHSFPIVALFASSLSIRNCFVNNILEASSHTSLALMSSFCNTWSP